MPDKTLYSSYEAENVKAENVKAENIKAENIETGIEGPQTTEER